MKKSIFYNDIARIYEEVSKKDSDGKNEKEMAKAIIEVFGNRNELTETDEHLCELAFREHTPFESNEEKSLFIRDMEGFQIRAEKPAFGDKFSVSN